MGHRYLGSNLQTSMSRSLNLNLQAMTINVWACEVVTHIWLMMTAEPLHCGYRPLIIQTSQRNFLAVLNTTTRPSARTLMIVFLMKQSVKQYDVTVILQFWLYSTWFCSSHCPQKLTAWSHPHILFQTLLLNHILWQELWDIDMDSGLVLLIVLELKVQFTWKLKRSSFIYNHVAPNL